MCKDIDSEIILQMYSLLEEVSDDSIPFRIPLVSYKVHCSEL